MTARVQITEYSIQPTHNGKCVRVQRVGSDPYKWEVVSGSLNILSVDGKNWLYRPLPDRDPTEVRFDHVTQAISAALNSPVING